MDIINHILLLADIVDEPDIVPAGETMIGSGAFILFGLVAVAIVIAAVLLIVGISKRNKK